MAFHVQMMLVASDNESGDSDSLEASLSCVFISSFVEVLTAVQFILRNLILYFCT